jgi:hypothetical protein
MVSGLDLPQEARKAFLGVTIVLLIRAWLAMINLTKGGIS